MAISSPGSISLQTLVRRPMRMGFACDLTSAVYLNSATPEGSES
jgi:hypothetical protein